MDLQPTAGSATVKDTPQWLERAVPSFHTPRRSCCHLVVGRDDEVEGDAAASDIYDRYIFLRSRAP